VACVDIERAVGTELCQNIMLWNWYWFVKKNVINENINRTSEFKIVDVAVISGN
jgi:hypothetical protein